MSVNYQCKQIDTGRQKGATVIRLDVSIVSSNERAELSSPIRPHPFRMHWPVTKNTEEGLDKINNRQTFPKNK